MDKKYVDMTSETEYLLEITLKYSDSKETENRGHIQEAAEDIVDAYNRHKDNFKSFHAFLEHVEIQGSNLEENILIYKRVKKILKEIKGN